MTVLTAVSRRPAMPPVRAVANLAVPVDQRRLREAVRQADFENIADKNYRAPGWGIDGPGRSLTVRVRHGTLRLRDRGDHGSRRHGWPGRQRLRRRSGTFPR